MPRETRSPDSNRRAPPDGHSYTILLAVAPARLGGAPLVAAYGWSLGARHMLPPMDWRGMACRLPLAGTAVGGTVAGHTLAYALYDPDPGTRQVLLAGSGHTYWSAAIAAATVLGLVSIGTTVTGRFRAGAQGQGRHAPDPPCTRLAAHLALLQATIYLVQEVLERLAVGVPLTDAINGRQLLLGVSVQVLVAVALAVLVTWAGRAAEVAGATFRYRRVARPRPTTDRPRPVAWVRPTLLVAAGHGGRAPPR